MTTSPPVQPVARPGQVSLYCANGAAKTLDTIAATIELFDLCKPAPDTTVSRKDLEGVLERSLRGPRSAARFVEVLAEVSGSGPPRNRVDFLSYWHSVDKLFAELGIGGASVGKVDEGDTLHGLQRFRDGVLQIWREQGAQDAISAQELLALLGEIRNSSANPKYWDEVMQAVPCEEGFGLAIGEVAEAVYVWLKEKAKGGADSPEDQFCSPSLTAVGGTSPVFCRFSQVLDTAVSPSCVTPEMQKRRVMGSARISTWSDPGSGASDIQRAHELAELLARKIDPGKDAHRVITKLITALEHVQRTLHNQESELSRVCRSNAQLSQRHAQLEEELSRAHEQYEDLQEIKNQREDHKRRADALERELDGLKEHYSSSDQVLGKLEAESLEVQRQLTENNYRDLQWQNRCKQLEHAADNAEGQARWMRSKLDSQAKQIEEAQASEGAARRELAKLRRGMRAAASAARSHVAYALESEEAAFILQQQALSAHSSGSVVSGCPAGAVGSTAIPSTASITGSDAATVNSSHQAQTAQAPQVQLPVEAPAVRHTRETQTPPAPSTQLAAHAPELRQEELRQLRTLRDELLQMQSGVPQYVQDSDTSPRRMQVERRNAFLNLQLKTVLRHLQEVEELLDKSLAGSLEGGAGSAKEKRQLSVKRMQEEGASKFDELSDQLYTIQVQKNEVEEELRRQQAHLSEQSEQLAHARQRCKELLEQRGEVSLGESNLEPHRSVSQKLVERSKQACGRSTATSVTLSTASGAPGGAVASTAAGSDIDWFLANGPPSSTLQHSPKRPLVQSVNKVVRVHNFIRGAIPIHCPGNLHARAPEQQDRNSSRGSSSGRKDSGTVHTRQQPHPASAKHSASEAHGKHRHRMVQSASASRAVDGRRRSERHKSNRQDSPEERHPGPKRHPTSDTNCDMQ